MVRTLVIPDVHIPFEHKRHTRRMFKFARSWKPDRVVLLGDVMDFHSLTTHRQSKEWQDELEIEVKAGRAFFKKLRDSVGTKCVIECIEGNHEDRWNRYVEGRAPVIRNIGVDWQEYVGFTKYNIKRAVHPFMVNACAPGIRLDPLTS